MCEAVTFVLSPVTPRAREIDIHVLIRLLSICGRSILIWDILRLKDG
jgi:hypothetical protein